MRINPFAGCSEEEMLILKDIAEVEEVTSERNKDIWVTKDGTHIPVNKLSIAHINNIINYFGTVKLKLLGYSNIIKMYEKFQNEKL